MNFTDFLIIYLACGAPCGVYFFLQNRKNFSAARLWLKSFLTVFVWIPYAFRLLHDFATKRFAESEISPDAERLVRVQKAILELQNNGSGRLSPFELREVLDRYAGLTLACRGEVETPTAPEREVFRVALRQNAEIGAGCLHRRNRQRLLFHQMLAREDFLKTISILESSVSDRERLRELASELTGIVKDEEAGGAVAAIFDERPQTEGFASVRKVENVVWIPREHKPSAPANPRPAPLRRSRRTASVGASNNSNNLKG